MTSHTEKNIGRRHTDIRGLDHAHVVTAIADAAHPLPGMLPDEARDVRLLRRRAAARDDGGELRRDLDELVLEQVQAELQRLAVDDEAAVELVLQEVQLVAELVRRLDWFEPPSARTHETTKPREGGRGVLTLLHLVDVLVPRDQLRGYRDARRGLHLVARQHPDLDPRVPEQLQRRLHVVLQLVLHARQPQELQIVLQILPHDRRHRLVARLEPDARGVVLRPELRVRLVAQLPARHDERAQALARHVRGLLLEPVVALHDPAHHDVGALLQERDLAGLRVAHDDAHALRLGREGEELEDLEGETRACGRLQLDARAVAEGEREPDGLGPFDDGDFVGGGGLVCYGAVVVGDGRDLELRERCLSRLRDVAYIVTQSKTQNDVVHTRRHVSPSAARDLYTSDQ